jgi:Antimicrobial peptide resistance and lipid A acylation protein PagP
MNAPITRMTAIAALAAAAWSSPAQAAAPSQQWFLQTAALSYHFEPTRAPGREWNEVHAGLGLERRDIDVDSPWQVRWSASAMRDSRNFWSGYGGAAYMRQWRPVSTIEASLGVSAFISYRAVDWRGRREWTPALLPTASIGSADGTLGMNIVYVPRIGRGDEGATPPTLIAQFIFRFR